MSTRLRIQNEYVCRILYTVNVRESSNKYGIKDFRLPFVKCSLSVPALLSHRCPITPQSYHHFDPDSALASQHFVCRHSSGVGTHCSIHSRQPRMLLQFDAVNTFTWVVSKYLATYEEHFYERIAPSKVHVKNSCVQELRFPIWSRPSRIMMCMPRVGVYFTHPAQSAMGQIHVGYPPSGSWINPAQIIDICAAFRAIWTPETNYDPPLVVGHTMAHRCMLDRAHSKKQNPACDRRSVHGIIAEIRDYW